MGILFTEKELRQCDEESKRLSEAYDPRKYKTFEEKVKACNAIPIEEFFEMGRKMIREKFQELNGKNSFDK